MAEVHGPIGARIPGLRRLVQSYALADRVDETPADFDGMAELWFDDVVALRAARLSRDWRASTADEVNFVAPGTSVSFVAQERQILPSLAPPPSRRILT